MKKLLEAFGPAVLICGGTLLELSTAGELSNLMVTMLLLAIVFLSGCWYFSMRINESLEERVQIWRGAFERNTKQLENLLIELQRRAGR